MRDRVPAVVVVGVALYAVAVAIPALMPVAIAAAVTALGALALLRRDHPTLAAALGSLGLLAGVLLGGTLLLGARPRAGFIYVVGVVFFLFLPVAPWLYAKTWFRGGSRGAGGEARRS